MESSITSNGVILSPEQFKAALGEVEERSNRLGGDALKQYLTEAIKFYRRGSEQSGMIFCDRSSHLCRLLYLKAASLFPEGREGIFNLLPENEKSLVRLLHRDAMPERAIGAAKRIS